MASFVQPHMVAALATHALEDIIDIDEIGTSCAHVVFRGFRMRRPNTGTYRVLLLFTEEGIVLAGDLQLSDTPGGGLVSAKGYGLDWFAGDLSEDYLCEKFLTKVWEAPRAATWCRETATAVLNGDFDEDLSIIGDDGSDDDEPVDAATIRADRAGFAEQLTDLADALERNAHSGDSFVEELQEIGFEFEDSPGYDYPSADAGWLIAIQRRFRDLYATFPAPPGKKEALPC